MEDTTAEPTPYAAGTFAVYDLPDGGVLLVTRLAGGDEQKHHVPGPLVVAAKTLANGEGLNPAALVRAFRTVSAGRRALTPPQDT